MLNPPIPPSKIKICSNRSADCTNLKSKSLMKKLKILISGKHHSISVILEYPLEYVVAKAHAVDLDISPNNLIRYTIESIIYTKGRKSYNTDQAFNINTRDGVISIGTYDYSDFVGGYFNITVVAEDATGEYQGSDKMTVMVGSYLSDNTNNLVFRVYSHVRHKPACAASKIGRSLKFRIKKERGLYYPCDENKDADQLCSYVCLCFHTRKNFNFDYTL